MHKKILQLGILITLALSFAACSEDDESAKVKFETVPENPIVITGDIEKNGDVIKAPWFSHLVKVTNDSTKNVTIVAFTYKVRAISQFGTTIEKEASISAASGSYTLTSGDETCIYDIYTFDTVPAGAVDQFLTVTPTLTGAAACPAPTTYAPYFFLGENPNKEDDQVTNYFYSIEWTPLGWFGTQLEPSDRFEKLEYIFTQ